MLPRMKKALLSLALLASCGAPDAPDGMPPVGETYNLFLKPVSNLGRHVQARVKAYEGPFMVMNIDVAERSDTPLLDKPVWREYRVRCDDIEGWGHLLGIGGRR